MAVLPDVVAERAREVLAASSAVCIAVFDQNGDITYTNSGMTALLTRCGCGTRSFVNPEIDQLLALVPAAAADTVIFEGVATVGDGMDMWSSLNATAVSTGSGLLLIGEFDARELERLNHEMSDLNREVNNLHRQLMKEKAALSNTLAMLRDTQEQLIHSEKMGALGKLVAGVAHEISNLIAFVSSNLHSLQNSARSLLTACQSLGELARAEQAEHLQQIRDDNDLDFIEQDLDDLIAGSLDGLKRVQRIVQDLRTFSRHDEADFKTVDLTACLDATIVIAGPELKTRGVEVSRDYSNLPPVACFPSELNQVFLNLIVNAAQAMQDGGSLSIRTNTDGARVKLTFIDTGCGMLPDVCRRVFEPFYTTKPVGEGTGLGLSVSYRIVTERHRGTISVDSEPGGGSTFTIEIPLKQPDRS